MKALLELTDALEGTYGDEGPAVRTALDRMSAALAQWDREIQAAATAVATTTADAASGDRRLSLARMYADRGRFVEALSELDAAGAPQPPRADDLVLRGLVLHAAERVTDSIKAFDAALIAEPDNPTVAYYLFREASIIGDLKEARHAGDVLLAALPRLTSAAPKQAPFAQLGLAQSATTPPLVPLAAYSPAFRLIARREYEQAIQEFRKAASTDPLLDDPAAGSTAIPRAVAALRQGRFEEARAQIQRDKSLAGSSEAQRVLGLIYWADSDYDRSIAALKDAIRQSPRNERARLALSRVLSTAGREAEAAVALQETLSVLPESALAHWWLASSYERVNRFADARTEYERAVEWAIAGGSQLYGAIGRLADGAADGPGAINAFTRAVASAPNDTAMHRSLGHALAQQDRGDEALAEFIAAILIDPRDAEAYAGVGQVHLNAGRVAEAATVLQRATDLAPTNNEARYTLATALARLGRTDEAAGQFARVEQEQRQMIAESRRTLSHDVLKEEAALRVAEGRFDVAITLYESALEVRADPDIYRRLAELYAKVGRAADAARAGALYAKTRQGRQSGTER